MGRFLILAGLVTAGALPRAVGAQVYRPSFQEPAGVELVAVYVGATSCVPCRAPAMPALLDSMKVQLQRQAEAAGQRFRAVFVAIDWEPDSGLALAREDGRWDELIVGRNWMNLGAQQYIWADSVTVPTMPQVILYEQEVATGGRVLFGERRVLRRIYGLSAMTSWVALGSPRS